MQVLCIHVFGTEGIGGVPILVEVGGIYQVVGRGTFPDGQLYYELAHQPGVGYYANCFVPLDPWNDAESYFLNQNDKTMKAEMTPYQKDIVKRLCDGMYVREVGDRFKLYEGRENPVLWIYRASLRKRILPLLRWKNGKGTLDRKAVLSLHGNDWIKKHYKAKKYGAKYK
jgi:hypothetical protein